MAPVRKYGDSAPVVNAPGEKPLRVDARRNRQRVLDAAREAFATDGLAVPLDDIARRAGVGAGTVYRHFPTKEALFEAVMVERMQQLAEESRDRAADSDSTEALLRFVRYLIVEAAPKKDLIDALTTAGADLHQVLGEIADEMRGHIARMLSRAQRTGGIRRDIRIAELMALLSAVITAGHGRGHTSDPPRIDRIADVVCDGLREGARRG
jgi:AcrR family transcriptional regulator